MERLLKEQHQVSNQRPLQADDVSASSFVVTSPSETVALYYSNSGTRTTDAGQAAATAVMGQFAFKNILDVDGSKLATFNDTSMAFTGDCFTSEIKYPMDAAEVVDDDTWANKLSAITSGFTNGQYCIDYRSGTIYGVKATTTSSLTSVTYKINQAQSGGASTLPSNVQGEIAHDAAASGTNPLLSASEAKNFDGSALPNAVNAEGDVVRDAASLSGIGYVMPVNEDGSGTPVVTHDTTIAAATGGNVGLMPMVEAADFDGSALPNAVNAEGDAVRTKASLSGVPYTMLTGEDGSSTPIADHDAAIGTGIGVGTVLSGLEAKNFDGSALPNAVGAESDAVRQAGSLSGVAYSMPVSEDGSETPIAIHDTAISAANGGSAGLMQAVEAKDFDGSALPNAVAEGDAVRPAGSLNGVTFAMLTDEDGSDTPVVAEDAAIAAATGGTAGLMTMMESRTGQKSAMSATGDAVRPVADEYGQAVPAQFTWATRSARSEEIDPLSSHYLNESLVDTTNVSAATHYYPSSTGGTMDGYKDQSLTGKFIDADGTLTLTLEVTNDEDTSGDWNGAYFYDDELNATVNTKTVTNGTELFSLSCNNNNFRRYRWVVVASGATNTVILKERRKAL
jgi:hypothetical protein